jgi:hypothetical protein
MGCDIHPYAEVRSGGQWHWAHNIDPNHDPAHPWEMDEVFPDRNYAWFGFLADVRNYSHSPVIAEPRGLPDDVSPELIDKFDPLGWAHSHSWLTLAELLAYDYDQIIWDRRVTKQTGSNSWDGAALADEGEGRHLPLREFLGQRFFDRIALLSVLGDPQDVRVVFWFDS